MVIFLYGPDDYRRAQRKKYWINEFEKKHSGLSVGYFDFAEAGSTRLPSARFGTGTAGGLALDDLKSFVRGQSIFEEKKLAVVENLYEADEKASAKELRLLVDKKSTTILFSEKKLPNKALLFLVEKPAVAEEFPQLSGAELEMFVRAEAKKIGLALDNSAMQFLAQVYGGNMWGLVTELQKLSGMGKVVSRKELEFLGLEVAPNYFAVLNSLKSGDVRNRLWALEKMFAMGDPPPKIFNILASQWKEKIPQMAEYDLAVKSGKLEYEEVLTDLVISN